MRNFIYKTEQLLPVSLDQAWGFFSSPMNLAEITPGNPDFKITSKTVSGEIFEGMIIEYRLKPLGNIPLRWRTRISDVDRPYSFTDVQLKGPYRVWEHRHEFTETKRGVLVLDEVKYRLPFGWIGRLAHRLVVRKRIAEIFEYRRQKLQKIFGHG